MSDCLTSAPRTNTVGTTLMLKEQSLLISGPFGHGDDLLTRNLIKAGRLV